MKKLKIIANNELSKEIEKHASEQKYGYWPNPASVKSFKQMINAVKIDITLLMNESHMNGHNFQILTAMLVSLDTMVIEVFDHLNKTNSLFMDEMDMDEIEDMNNLQKDFKETMEQGYKTHREFKKERCLEREADGKVEKEETKE